MSADPEDDPRRLVLLRHAKAEHHGGVPDEMRALNPTGRRQAVEVGSRLAEAGLVPDVVLCSTSVRTRQTWELVARGLSQDPEVEYSEDLYLASMSSTLAVVTAAPARARTVLVVGHEPTMSGLAAALADPGSDPSALVRVRAGLSTGAFAVLEVAAPWSGLQQGGALLTRVVAPSRRR